MSLAIIKTFTPFAGTNGITSSPLDVKVTLGTMSRNEDGTVSLFNDNSAASNPNTFVLSAGTYRIEVTITILPSLNNSQGTNTTLSSWAIALFDEVNQTVSTTLSPVYNQQAPDTMSGWTFRKNLPFRAIGSVVIPSAQKLFSIRLPAGPGFYLFCGQHGVTATLGGSALSNLKTIVKIIKTS